MYWLALVPFCTVAFGLHGGQFITGINRQVRNSLCAAPFGLVAYMLPSTMYDFPLGFLFFSLAYIGVNMSFDKFPLWFKGLVTIPPFGAALLPLAYWIGYKTRWTNVVAEYLSGFLYGVALFALVKYVP